MTRTDRRRFPVLFAAIAALLALFGALALPATAQVQTTTTFVSNLGQSDAITDSFTSPSTPRAQQFETGSNSRGYTLSEIVVNIRDARTGTPAFALYTSTADDKPDTKVVDLNGDSSTAGEQSFAPASATTLSASTKYFIRFSMTSGQANLQRTGSDNIDSGASTGWDIAENSLLGTNSSANSVEIAVKGTAVTCPLNTGDLWCGEITVAALNEGTGTYGHGFLDADPDQGALSDTTFSVGTNDYTIDLIYVNESLEGGTLQFSLTSNLTAADKTTLVLHIDGSSDTLAFSPVAPNAGKWLRMGGHRSGLVVDEHSHAAAAGRDRHADAVHRRDAESSGRLRQHFGPDADPDLRIGHRDLHGVGGERRRRGDGDGDAERFRRVDRLSGRGRHDARRRQHLTG